MEIDNDQFEIKRTEQKNKLQSCQEKYGLNSCFNCPKLLECETRTSYVDAVYASMSKGVSGGFDF